MIVHTVLKIRLLNQRYARIALAVYRDADLVSHFLRRPPAHPFNRLLLVTQAGPLMATKHPKRPRDANQWAKMIVDLAHVNTSNIERSNLTMRMGNRRFTQPTNALSKNA